MQDDDQQPEIIEPAEEDLLDLPPRSKGGRPYALVDSEKTRKQIWALGELHCTVEEAAGALGVGHTTLRHFFDRHPEIKDIFDNGRMYGKSSVKRAQYIMAHRVPQMSIWWGKQNLNQADKSETTQKVIDATPESTIDRVVELQRKARQLAGKAPEDTPNE